MTNLKQTNPTRFFPPFFFPALAAAALHLEAPGVKEKWVFPSKYPLFANPENQNCKYIYSNASPPTQEEVLEKRVW